MPYPEPIFPLGIPIAPTAFGDENPTHIAEYGRGGLHSVAGFSDLEDMPLTRQTVGMIGYVADEDAYYQLAGSGWVPFSPALVHFSGVLASDITLVINTWTQVFTQLVSPGTYLIVANACTLQEGSVLTLYEMRVKVAGVVVASSQAMHQAALNSVANMSCSAISVVTIPSTVVTVEVIASQVSKVKAATSPNASINATTFQAIRIV